MNKIIDRRKMDDELLLKIDRHQKAVISFKNLVYRRGWFKRVLNIRYEGN